VVAEAVQQDITVQTLNQEVLVVAEMRQVDLEHQVHQVKEILEVQVLHTHRVTLEVVAVALEDQVATHQVRQEEQVELDHLPIHPGARQLSLVKT
jgi:hypothetical protein